MVITELEQELFGESYNPLMDHRGIRGFDVDFKRLRDLEYQIRALDNKICGNPAAVHKIHPKVYSGYCEREIELDEDCLDEESIKRILENLKEKYKRTYMSILIMISEYARDNKEFLDKTLDDFEKSHEEKRRKMFERIKQAGSK